MTTTALPVEARLRARPGAESASQLRVHRLAVATLACTFVLIVLGGIVTSLDVGMAVPDWPTTFGHSMFGFPLDQMVADMGVFYEHSHRLAGALLGLLAIALVLAAWLARGVPASWKRLSAAALVLVCIQGALGGLRVLEDDRGIAVIHAIGAQAVLVVLVILAIITSRRWNSGAAPFVSPDAKRLRLLSVAAVGALFVHLLAGAGLRHQQTGVESHLWLALTVTVVLLAVASTLLTGFRGHAVLARRGRQVVMLLAAQLALGFATWAFKHGPLADGTLVELHAFLATAHLFAGAAIMAVAASIALEARGSVAAPEETA